MPMLAPTVTGSGAPIVQGAEMLADTQEFLVEPDAVGQPGQSIVEGKKGILPLGAYQGDGVAILSPKDAAHTGHEDRCLDR